MDRATLLTLSRNDLIALVEAQAVQIATMAETQARQISALAARIAELDARLATPPKNPDNSSLPPSKGQKSNLPDRAKTPRPSRPGVARALAEHPDRIIEATLSACPHCDRALGPADMTDVHAYDHVDLPSIRPIVTRINRHRGVCPCCRRAVSARPPEGLEPGSRFGPGIAAVIIHGVTTRSVQNCTLRTKTEGRHGPTTADGAGARGFLKPISFGHVILQQGFERESP